MGISIEHYNIYDGSSFSASNPTEITNMFDRYFYSVFQFSDRNIDETDFSTSNDDQSTNIFSGIELTPDEVYHVLSNLDENKATGPDKIPAILLKNCASTISSSLWELFNKSLALGELPGEWKLSNIIPIPKRCRNDEVTNYIDQFPYCPWCPKPLNDVSTTS